MRRLKRKSAAGNTGDAAAVVPPSNVFSPPHHIIRVILVVLSSVIMALDINSFVNAGDLIPGGFTGLTLLIQQIGARFFDLKIAFSPIYILLNAIPIIISFKFIGKKFTLYSCLAIVLTSVLVDILPGYPLTYDPLLISVFGGIICGVSVSLALSAQATTGGTDFIAIFFSERHGIDIWNYIFAANVVILSIAGLLFGWDKALYSIIFQFTATQILNLLYKRYQKNTLLIITTYPDQIYQAIKECTNHDATLFKGTGCYANQERNMIYSVVNSDETKMVISNVKKIDPTAFVNVVKTERITGIFYKRPND